MESKDRRSAAILLNAVAGALKGTSFRLSIGDISLGADAENDIPIVDLSVSPRHCAIRGDGRQFIITNLNVGNSTFVNGISVNERVLKPGDEVRVGNSVFMIVSDRNGELADRRRQGPTPPMDSRVLADFNALLQISTILNSLSGVAAIQRQVLNAALDVAPAERAAIVMLEDSSERCASVIALNRETRRDCEIEVKQSVIERVIAERVAILSNDAPEGGSAHGADPPGRRLVRSLLAIPIETFERILGVLYLDGVNFATRFDENLLQFLAAVGSIAAIAIENSRRLEMLEGENRTLHAEINIEHSMVGDSPRMRQLYKFITKVAPSDSTVLVGGESGTGKELVARAIHNNSTRTNRLFVAINCAAITETLLESELFGHEKGAFTGAVAQKKGKLEVAEGGTVFLDEIGELAAALQAKLLRVLQEREFERVGGTRPIKLNVRVIAATNRDLAEAVKSGSFRQDLYHRLNVVSVRMPALRERKEDIPLLATYFARKYGAKANRTITGLSARARAGLLNYDWPGNVRELENAIERAVVMGSTNSILPEDLPEAVFDKPVARGVEITRYHEGVQRAKKQIILKAMEQSGGSYTDAARLLGVHVNYLHRLMKNLSLRDAQADAG